MYNLAKRGSRAAMLSGDAFVHKSLNFAGMHDYARTGIYSGDQKWHLKKFSSGIRLDV